MSTALPIPPSGVELIDRTTRNVSTQWQNYFQQLVTAILAAGGAPSDAEYWTSKADGTLTNEQNMALLGTGYLKQTVAAGVSTPSTTAKIPVADVNPYHTGTWTPSDTSGAGLGFVVTSATYVNIGSLVGVQAQLLYPATADPNNAQVGSLPFVSIGADYPLATSTSLGSAIVAVVNGNAATVNFYDASKARITNASLSGISVTMSGIYRT